MSIKTILIVILVLMLVGALPAWPHSAEFGYQPAVGLLLIIVILMLFRVR